MEDVKMNPTFSAGEVRSIEAAPPSTTPSAPAPEPAINPDKNEAVEGTTAHDEVLRAIFGDSDSE
jgi:G patch domain-containing protein 1